MAVTYNNSVAAREGALSIDMNTYSHPDYKYNKDDWIAIRDTITGERAVKDKGTLYLPGLSKQDGAEYQAYKQRASFVNMTGRTLAGLVATIFRRPLKLENLLKDKVQSVSITGDSLDLFAKKMAYELTAMGRVAVLVDMPTEGGVPYFSEYVAENIISWKTRSVNGVKVPVYVLLREIVDNTPKVSELIPTYFRPGVLEARYRVLTIDTDGVYRQRVYTDLGSDPIETVVPTKNGQPMDFIPMVCFGVMSLGWEVQKSPLLDIVNLNLAHYRTSAQLEHGRFFTALPVYWVPVPASGSANTEGVTEYQIGPSVVWEVAGDGKPGILEYFGSGLVSLQNSLVEKETHIAQLSGRIMGNTTSGAPENQDVYRLRQANELAILSNVTDSLSEGLTKLVRWRLDWMREKSDTVRVKVNQDFRNVIIAARELRALALLYSEGLLPIEEMYRVLQNSGFIDDEVTLEDFKALLKSSNSFPNNSTVPAKREGYHDARDLKKYEDKELDREAKEKEAAAAAATAEKIAKTNAESSGGDGEDDEEEKTFAQGRRTQQFEKQGEK